jgi:chromosome segregation ATPase
MSALRAVAPPVAEVSALDLARARVTDLKAKLAAVETSVARAENATSPVEQTATQAQSLRQRIKAKFAAMLQAGKLDTGESEVVDLNIQLAAAEGAERQAAAIAEARRTVVADYQSQAADLRSQLATATLSLKELLFTAAGADIEQRLITAYLEAFQKLADAKAELDGGGQAHNEMARPLREHGISVQALGTDLPEKFLIAHPTGYGISSNGQFNTLRIDCSASIEAARVAFREKWSS